MRSGINETAGQLSTKLWRGLDTDLVAQGPRPNVEFFYENFFGPIEAMTSAGSNKQGQLVLATTGDVSSAGVQGGGLLIDSDSTTDNQGANFFVPGAVVTPAAGRTICFETRLSATDIASGIQLVAGLVDADDVATQMSADALTATDFMTFYSTGATGTAGLIKFSSTTASIAGATTVSSGIHTLTASTYVQLGFRVNGLDNVEVYADGALVDSTTITTATIPSATPLRPVFACITVGTTTPQTTVKWYAVGSMENVI